MSPTRSQQLVATLLADPKLREQANACSHLMNLPQLLQRHGLLQTVLFLHRKSAGVGDDATKAAPAQYGALLTLLDSGVKASLGDKVAPTLTGPVKNVAAALASLELPILLASTDAAIETAGWLRQLYLAEKKVAETAAALAAPDPEEEPDHAAR